MTRENGCIAQDINCTCLPCVRGGSGGGQRLRGRISSLIMTALPPSLPRGERPREGEETLKRQHSLHGQNTEGGAKTRRSNVVAGAAEKTSSITKRLKAAPRRVEEGKGSGDRNFWQIIPLTRKRLQRRLCRRSSILEQWITCVKEAGLESGFSIACCIRRGVGNAGRYI